MPAPWQVTDAPPDYIDTMLRAIVGIGSEVTALTGKWKVARTATPPTGPHVAAGLAALGAGGDAQAAAMAGEQG